MPDWRTVRLDRSHPRSEFACGKPPLDEFLRTLVSQYEKRHLGRTYVGVRAEERRVYGYYTLASGSLAFQNLPDPAARRLPRHPVPVILLASLAVDQSVQGQGLGESLLIDALKRCLGLADQVGVHAIEVDAIDDPARRFYERYGLVPLADGALHLYMTMTTIRDAFGQP